MGKGLNEPSIYISPSDLIILYILPSFEMMWKKYGTIKVQFYHKSKNIVAKGEIAHNKIACYKQFLNLPQCFLKSIVCCKSSACWEGLN